MQAGDRVLLARGADSSRGDLAYPYSHNVGLTGTLIEKSRTHFLSLPVWDVLLDNGRKDWVAEYYMDVIETTSAPEKPLKYVRLVDVIDGSSNEADPVVSYQTPEELVRLKHFCEHESDGRYKVVDDAWVVTVDQWIEIESEFASGLAEFRLS